MSPAASTPLGRRKLKTLGSGREEVVSHDAAMASAFLTESFIQSEDLHLELIVGHSELSLHLAEITKCPTDQELTKNGVSGSIFIGRSTIVVPNRKNPQRL